MKVLGDFAGARGGQGQMNIPCGVNASGESDLRIAQGVCAADVNIDLDEGQVLIGNGAYVGRVQLPVAVLQQGRRTEAAGRRRAAEWSHFGRRRSATRATGPNPIKWPAATKMATSTTSCSAAARDEIVARRRPASPQRRGEDRSGPAMCRAAAEAALKASTVFSPSAKATPPSATAMISSLAPSFLDRGNWFSVGHQLVAGR